MKKKKSKGEEEKGEGGRGKEGKGKRGKGKWGGRRESQTTIGPKPRLLDPDEGIL